MQAEKNRGTFIRKGAIFSIDHFRHGNCKRNAEESNSYGIWSFKGVLLTNKY